MSWTAPLTATTGQFLTAAQWNVCVRDNLWETEPAQATGNTHLIVTDGAHSVAERTVNRDYVTAAEATASQSYANLETWGPQVLVITGTAAVQFVCGRLWNNTAGCGSYMAYAVWQGDSEVIPANDGGGLAYRSSNANDWVRASAVGFNNFTLIPGYNRFITRYRCSSNTANFDLRELIVVPL